MLGVRSRVASARPSGGIVITDSLVKAGTCTFEFSHPDRPRYRALQFKRQSVGVPYRYATGSLAPRATAHQPDVRGASRRTCTRRGALVDSLRAPGAPHLSAQSVSADWKKMTAAMSLPSQHSPGIPSVVVRSRFAPASAATTARSATCLLPRVSLSRLARARQTRGRRHLRPRRRRARSNVVRHRVQHPYTAAQPPSTFLCARRRCGDGLARAACADGQCGQLCVLRTSTATRSRQAAHGRRRLRSDRSRPPSPSGRRLGRPVAPTASTAAPPISIPTALRGLRA